MKEGVIMRARLIIVMVAFFSFLITPFVYANTNVPLYQGESVRLGVDVLGLNGKIIANLGDTYIKCNVSRPFLPAGSVIFTFDVQAHDVYQFNGFHWSDHVKVICESVNGDTSISYHDVIVD